MARKLRAVLPDLALKGEKEVVTEVRNRVIIVADRRNVGRPLGWLKTAAISFEVQEGGVCFCDGLRNLRCSCSKSSEHIKSLAECFRSQIIDHG